MRWESRGVKVNKSGLLSVGDSYSHLGSNRLLHLLGEERLESFGMLAKENPDRLLIVDPLLGE